MCKGLLIFIKRTIKLARTFNILLTNCWMPAYLNTLLIISYVLDNFRLCSTSHWRIWPRTDWTDSVRAWVSWSEMTDRPVSRCWTWCNRKIPVRKDNHTIKSRIKASSTWFDGAPIWRFDLSQFSLLLLRHWKMFLTSEMFKSELKPLSPKKH